jgi:hypothetical protein
MKPCLDCGRLTHQSRCSLHQASHDSVYATAAYLTEREVVLRAEPWCHNPACPYPDAGTPANPLTADHTVPVVFGGAGSPLVPVCRRCNSARGARHGRYTWDGLRSRTIDPATAARTSGSTTRNVWGRGRGAGSSRSSASVLADHGGLLHTYELPVRGRARAAQVAVRGGRV